MLVAKLGLEKVRTQLTLVAIHVSGEPPKSEGILIQWRCYFAPLVRFFVFYQTILFSKGIIRHVRGIHIVLYYPRKLCGISVETHPC